MMMHLKILRKRLNKTRDIAQKCLDVLRENLSPQRREFRCIICPEALPGLGEKVCLDCIFIPQDFLLLLKQKE